MYCIKKKKCSADGSLLTSWLPAHIISFSIPFFYGLSFVLQSNLVGKSDTAAHPT